MKVQIQNHWPVIVALIVLWMTITVLLSFALQQTKGHLTYTLDDAYIHMAMAKNLACHGVYGVTQYEFSSSSSSPLWTLLLALLYFIFGVREWLPFVLNLLIASAILIFISELLRRASFNKVLSVIALLAIMIFTPFPALIFSGMEHLLHIFIAIMFVWYFTLVLLQNDSAESALYFKILCLLSVAVTITRFESYSLILVSCVLLILRRKWKKSLVLFLAGLLPLLVYQFISVSKGWFWLPNSILIRSHAFQTEVFNSQQAIVINPIFSGTSAFFSSGLKNFLFAPHVSVLIVTSCFLLMVGWVLSGTFWKDRHVLLTVFIFIALAHIQFGKIGHFYRYEAYLVALGLFVIAFTFSELLAEGNIFRPVLWKGVVIGIVVLYFLIQGLPALFQRSKDSLFLTPLASRNIFQQQYQMGLFLKYFYPESNVAVNDIGAVSFLGDVHLLDLVGLASADVLRLKNENRFTTEQLQQVCIKKDVAIAMVYDYWFQLEGLQGVPREWEKVCDWIISYNVVCGSNVVSFYAVRASEKEKLINNLRKFSFILPASVGRYMPSANSEDSSEKN